MNKFIIAVVVIGVTLIIGIFIASSIQNVTLESTAVTVTNETGAYINATGYTLDGASANGFTGVSITIAYNDTSGNVINSGNYTVSSVGVVTNITTVVWNNVSISYGYTYDADTSTSDAAGDLVTALAGGSAWITILIVVGFATIVLGMLTQGLGRKEEDLESGYVY